ncbi:MAG TPA: metalloregulator ArsR/SmtB family transcription factor, partial [Acidimicrobiales bacterium]|nr:metalloregulator ArsR/SmtB family transcription factor [Acidimicrobiales bacterium]
GGPLPPLESESPEHRAAILERLDSLAANRRLRTRYRQLLADVWQPLEPAWRASELPRAESSRRHLEHLERQGRHWTEQLIDACEEWRQYLTEVAPARHVPVLVAVASFACKGSYLDLAATVYCCIGARHAYRADEELTAELGRRLKAVADPTRLALLRLLADAPRRVGELASDLELAQPTVSNHLKVLRETGIVNASRRGGELALDRDAVVSLMGDLGELLGTRSGG